LDRKEIIL